MLNVYFGSMPEEIYNTSVYFDNSYLDHWFEDELTRKIIKSVDKAEVLSSGAVNSRALGVIPVTKLSGGTKTLLLLRNKPELICNASTCGDNCAKWILKIAEKTYGTYLQYSKSKLNDNYLQENISRKIIRIIPNMIEG